MIIILMKFLIHKLLENNAKYRNALIMQQFDCFSKCI